jgi:hypothetical protein
MRSLFSLILLTGLLVSNQAYAADGRVVVFSDRAKVMKIDDNASTVIIGNPVFADAIVRPNNVLVVTGKTPGTTNMIILNQAGETISEMILHVTTDQSDVVILHKGVERYSYACTNRCENSPQVGDSNSYMENIIKQTKDRIGLAADEAQR